MDRDELREKIATVILEQAITIHGCSAPCNCRSVADSILSLLAPVLADAEKWWKVRKIFFDCSPCTGCTGCDIGSSESCKMVMRVNRFIGSNGVDALEGEGGEG